MEGGQNLRAVIDMLYALLLDFPNVDDQNRLMLADDVLKLAQMDIAALRDEIQDQVRYINKLNRQQGTGVG